MRNLKNLGRSWAAFADDTVPLTGTAWDVSSNSIICAFGPTAENAVIELKRLAKDGELSLIASWDAPCPNPEIPFDKIINLHYFSDTATCCLILAGGDIIVVRADPLPGEELIEILGSVDAGIAAATWSPDEELLAIVTCADTVLYMTREFENVTSINFSLDDSKLSKHVSVGWGKSETQFKGKRARALRDPTMPERDEEGSLSPMDGGEIFISWRGDGAFVAINKIEEQKRRMIRVYSRDGVLDSVSEPVDGLEGAISWRPSGNLIAGVQRLQDRVDIVLFERNGLRHGKFTSRVPQKEIGQWTSKVQLKWNTDSTVLAVCFPMRVELWTMSNYEYYLKQEIEYSNNQDGVQEDSVTLALWHPEIPLSISMGRRGGIERLQYAFTVACGSRKPPDDYGTVAVIDGCKLKLTPLRLANVPPPMSLHDIEMAGNVIDVAINATGTQIAAVYGDMLSVYSYNTTRRPICEPTLLWTTSISRPNFLVRQVAFQGDSEIYVLLEERSGKGSGLLRITKEDSESLVIALSTPSVYHMTTSVGGQEICLQVSEGTVYNYSASSSSDGNLTQICKFPSPMVLIDTIILEEMSIAFGLSSNGSLYANERLLVRNCTSFLVTPAHLILTTTQHLLKFVHLSQVHDLVVPPDEPEKDERCRSIERGARLITVMPTAYSLVLQMPRGNLETIYPRALVLAAIRKNIEAKEYGAAFLTCRNQRVDMNILHDHDPKQFMKEIELFISQVQKVEHIDLFLSQLRNEDVSQTMYKNTLAKESPLATSAIAANEILKESLVSSEAMPKVNRICDAFLNVLQSQGSGRLQNIITAHLCKTPPDIEAALEVVGDLQSNKSEMTDKAAEHICFLADVNQLYDNALGLYNLDLALLIAQNSQKDPREYLPYMQKLQNQDTLRRKFSIDNDLGRTKKALGHLHDLKAFDELKDYVSKHELYSDALELCRYDLSQYNEIMRLYADFLNSRNRFKEAGIAYQYLSDNNAAYEAYRAASLWRECLSTATLIPIPTEELTSLALSLAEGMTETKDYASAATIYLDYLQDIETSAKMLCKGYFFAEAIRIIGLRGLPDLLETVIDPGLIEGSASITELLADCKGQLGAQVPRLRELRVKKAEDPLAFFDSTGEVSADIPDNISVAPTDASTSGGTFMTRYTQRTSTSLGTTTTRKTSKNRRREERKRAKGKKGTVYEEEYLVNSISRLIERINSVNEDVTRLVQGLVIRKMRERAEAVQRAMADIVGACQACVGEVFSDQEESKQQQQQQGENSGTTTQLVGERPMGGDGVLWDSMQELGKKPTAPVIKAFEKLGLLG